MLAYQRLHGSEHNTNLVADSFAILLSVILRYV